MYRYLILIPYVRSIIRLGQTRQKVVKYKEIHGHMGYMDAHEPLSFQFRSANCQDVELIVATSLGFTISRHRVEDNKTYYTIFLK